MNTIALFEQPLAPTPIMLLSGTYGANRIYMKRDDLIPFSFGGNKARKAAEFYKEIRSRDVDVIMTYGSNSSNHCRIIANMAAAMELSCHIISPGEHRERLYNTRLVEQFGAVIETCPVDQVAETIDRRIVAYGEAGRKPYFITGGGHGNPGTESYVKAYREIRQQEKELGLHFSHIFHASGTGTTQAGLVCGQLLEGREVSVPGQAGAGTNSTGSTDRRQAAPQIAGISIAREAARGRQVVKDSIREYLGERFDGLYREEALLFTDEYRQGGYGNDTEEIRETIDRVMKREGIPMDTTYVGKAFYGMLQYLKEHQIEGEDVLFIHTGGGPLYFDRLARNE